MAAKSSKEAAWARGEFQGDLHGFGWTLHAQAGQEPAQQEYFLAAQATGLSIAL